MIEVVGSFDEYFICKHLRKDQIDEILKKLETRTTRELWKNLLIKTTSTYFGSLISVSDRFTDTISLTTILNSCSVNLSLATASIDSGTVTGLPNNDIFPQIKTLNQSKNKKLTDPIHRGFLILLVQSELGPSHVNTLDDMSSVFVINHFGNVPSDELVSSD